MRNLILCFLFLLCAAGVFAACDTPERVARREVDRITRITQRTEVNVKRTTREVMLKVATEEGAKLGQELKAAGCKAEAATQPALFGPPCKDIAEAGRARYEGRIKPIYGAASRVDKAIGGVYISLLAVLDVLEDVAAGLKPGGWEAKLAGVVADAVKLGIDLLAAFKDFKAAFGGGAP